MPKSRDVGEHDQSTPYASPVFENSLTLPPRGSWRQYGVWQGLSALAGSYHRPSKLDPGKVNLVETRKGILRQVLELKVLVREGRIPLDASPQSFPRSRRRSRSRSP